MSFILPLLQVLLLLPALQNSEPAAGAAAAAGTSEPEHTVSTLLGWPVAGIRGRYVDDLLPYIGHPPTSPGL